MVYRFNEFDGRTEEDDLLNIVGNRPNPSVTAPSAAQPTAPVELFDPRELLSKSFQTDPSLKEKLNLDWLQAYGSGEASSGNPFGLDIGGYKVVRGDPANYGMYSATKTDLIPDTPDYQESGLAGKKAVTTFNYDADGNVMGSDTRVFTGGDSGFVIRRDATGAVEGQPEGFDYSEDWKGPALNIANIALMALTGPATSSLTSALAPTLGQGLASQIAANAIIGAGRGAVLGGLTGQDIGKSALRGGIAAGAGAGLGSLAEQAGTATSKFIGPYLPEGVVGDALQSLSGNVAKGVVRDIGSSLVGSALTGRGVDIGSALTSGALSGLTDTVLEEAKANPTLKSLPVPLQNAALAALSAELRGKDPGSSAINALVGSIARSVAGQAKAAVSGGVDLGDAGQGIWEGWDPTGGEGISTGEAQRVEVPGSRVEPWEQEPFDLVEYLTPTKKPDQSVSVIGTKDSPSYGDAFLDELIRESIVEPPKQTVTVEGQRIPVEIPEPEDIQNQKVEVTATKLPTEVEDIQNQKVDVTGKKISSEPESKTTSTKTEEKKTTTTTPSVTTSPSRFMPIATRPVSQMQPLPLADVFYGKGAVQFGPGAPSMADVTDFQGRKAQARRSLELALEGEGGENQQEDAYTRLMALADESPTATIDELMDLIGRG